VSDHRQFRRQVDVTLVDGGDGLRCAWWTLTEGVAVVSRSKVSGTVVESWHGSSTFQVENNREMSEELWNDLTGRVPKPYEQGLRGEREHPRTKLREEC